MMKVISTIRSLSVRFGSKAVIAGAGVIVCAAAAAVFLFSGKSDTAVTTQSSESSSSAETSASTQQEQQTSRVETAAFKKAPLKEYDMVCAEQHDADLPDEPVDDEPEPDDPSGFKVQADTKAFSSIDKMARPAHLRTTRDTSKEFFTVRDITTGKIVTMNAFELVCSIVYNEVGDGWGSEAIKAQAVAAYSCLRYMDNIGMIETVGIKTNYTPKVQSCVKAVQGQVVKYNGHIANTLYSASTAGYTLPSNLAIVSSYPYLKSVKSAYDSSDPNWGVKSSFSKDDVRKKLEKRFKVKLSDDVKSWFRLTDVRYGKYVFGVSIGGKKSVSGSAVKELFGLRSTAFDITFSNNRFVFRSYGWGHGVGMSQWGACMYARHGCTYDQILTHYYTNTRIGISSVSKKAVERGKKSQQELEREAQTASETTTTGEQALPESEQTQATEETGDNGFETTTTKTSSDTQSESSSDPAETEPTQTTPPTEQTTQPQQTTVPETSAPQQTSQPEKPGSTKVTKSAQDAEQQ